MSSDKMSRTKCRGQNVNGTKCYWTKCHGQNVVDMMSWTKCRGHDVVDKMSWSKCLGQNGPGQNVVVKISWSKCRGRIVWSKCPGDIFLIKSFFPRHISGLHTAFWPLDALLTKCMRLRIHVALMLAVSHLSPLASWYQFTLLGEQGHQNVSSLFRATSQRSVVSGIELATLRSRGQSST